MKVVLMYRDLTHGGVQRIMVHIANYLARNGHKTTLLLGEAKGPYMDLIDPNIELISVDSKDRFLLIKRLILLLKERRPNILFTGVPSFNIMAIIAKYIANANTKVVISERSNTFKEFAKSTNLIYKLTFLGIPIIYRFSDAIVAVSQGVASDLSKFSLLPTKRINTIYNPAFNDSMEKQLSVGVEDTWLTHKTCPVIIGVGRLSKQKDFDSLIEAFCQVAQNRAAKLIIVGDGPLYVDLQKKIISLNLSDSVKLVGFQKNPISWISKADVFVLSSKWEGFGNILVEALAAGTTIVSTNCKSGPAEILKEGQLGYLVPVNDVDALAEKINYAIDHPMNKEVLREAVNEYHEDHIMTQYGNLFSTVLNMK